MSGTVEQLRRTGSRLFSGNHWSARIVRGIRSPSRGVSGEVLRFSLAGGTVLVVYLATTTTLADLVGLPFEVALVIGYLVAVVVHFTLQRIFVWIHLEGFALPMAHQAGRYLLASATIYGLTALATSILPGPLGVPTEAVYLATAALLACFNFVILRSRIFHGHSSST